MLSDDIGFPHLVVSYLPDGPISLGNALAQDSNSLIVKVQTTTYTQECITQDR